METKVPKPTDATKVTKLELQAIAALQHTTKHTASSEHYRNFVIYW
jgi:hypothetical protein